MDLRIESLTGRAHDECRRVVAIGNFDGVHLGHLQVLEAAVRSARSRNLIPSVLTFDPHPASIVSDRGAPARIQTRTSRRRALLEAGIEDLGELRFDEGVACLTPGEFVERALLDRLAAACVVVGEGFRFGAGRAGDVRTLRALGGERFETVEVPALSDSRGPISSSRIRDALRRGDLAEAERCLGRRYEVEGLVVHGDHRGRTLGYPTANIDLEDVDCLAVGIYAADGLIQGEEKPRRAAVSLGRRPTFGGSDLRLEAYFPGFEGDLYGRVIRLRFLARMRDEERFETVEELKQKIADDVARVVAFGGPSGILNA